MALQLRWDLDRQFSEARVLASYASLAVVDSLRELVRSWSVPPECWPSHQEPAYLANTAFATDRTAAAQGDSARRLPAAVRTSMTREPLACWAAAMREVDGPFSADDFTCTFSGPLNRYPLENRYPGILDSMGTRTAPHLVPSPDGRWLLDPFTGWGDVDRGFSVFEAASGNWRFYDVSTVWGIVAGAWLDNERFVLVGSSAVWGLKGPLDGVFAPTVWLGDVAGSTLELYQGAPLPIANRDTWRATLLACIRQAYPGFLAPGD